LNKRDQQAARAVAADLLHLVDLVQPIKVLLVEMTQEIDQQVAVAVAHLLSV
jgi:hypothetical protein